MSNAIDVRALTPITTKVYVIHIGRVSNPYLNLVRST